LERHVLRLSKGSKRMLCRSRKVWFSLSEKATFLLFLTLYQPAQGIPFRNGIQVAG
jgi:hypothetical protein